MNTTLAYAGGIVRIIVTLLGGYLIRKGWGTEADAESIVGAGVIVITGIWSIYAKRKAIIAAPPSSQSSVLRPPSSVLLLLLIPALLFTSGCATTWNRTPIMSTDSNGDTVVSDAVTLKIGIGTKEATSIGSYKLSSDGGLDITDLDEKTDSSATFIEGLRLGREVAQRYLDVQGFSAADIAPAPSATASAASQATAPAAKKSTARKAPTKKQATTTTSPALAAAIAEAKSSGKPLVVIAGSPTCGFCKTLEDLLTAAPDFTARTDIILYRETAPWSSNGALAWTGGGSAPIVRITRYDSSGKSLCNQVLNRPQTVAAISAAIDSCTAP